MAGTLTERQDQGLHDAASMVNASLATYFETLDLPENLLEALRYAVLGDGKRLRPVLVLLACDAVGGDRASAMKPAIALELIHCFSLVHDDLPAMDDDVLRRGRPTLHVHSGEAMAILAGDAMMSLAFECVTSTERDGSLDARQSNAIVSELAHGTTRMIAGQVYDSLGGLPMSLSPREQLELIHRNKTGALLTAACRIGGIAGRADEAQLAALVRYGNAVGLMYQIVDDLLDVTQSTDHLGKTAGKDESAGKLTFPSLFGIEQSRSEVKQLRETALNAVAPLGKAASGLMELGEYLAVRTK